MFNSIRIRLTLWYLSILALIIVAFAIATYFLIERNLNQTTNKNLTEIARSVEADLRKEEADIAEERRLLEAEKLKPSDEEDEEDEKDAKKTETEETPLTIEQAIVEEFEDLHSRDYGFVIFDGNRQQIASTVKDEKLKNALKNLSGEAVFADVSGENETVRGYRQPLELDGKRFQMLVTRSLREQIEFLANLRKIFFAGVPIALLLAGLGGYFLARRSLAPVVSMSRQAEKIGSSNLDKRLPVKNDADELGGLARVFNALLERLENSFRQQRRFMADASHELRTPLAIVRTESEVALSNEQRTAAEYRESLAIVHEESKHLTNIVEDLFLLARADAGQLKPQMNAENLDEILSESVRAISVLAEKQKVKIEFSSFGEMPLEADKSLLHRLFLNLLDNAVKYNRAGGTISIAAENGEKNYRITISDTGAGIAEADQAKIFERFYRADKARSRTNANQSGGAGLGLSIAAWIAETHQGSLTLKKSDADGSVFTIELPAAKNSL